MYPRHLARNKVNFRNLLSPAVKSQSTPEWLQCPEERGKEWQELQGQWLLLQSLQRGSAELCPETHPVAEPNLEWGASNTSKSSKTEKGHKTSWHVEHNHNTEMWKMQKDKSESFGNFSSIR